MEGKKGGKGKRGEGKKLRKRKGERK